MTVFLLETYVKSLTSKPGARKKYASSPFETYVKSNISKTLKTFVLRPKMIVESYVKLSTSKTVSIGYVI